MIKRYESIAALRADYIALDCRRRQSDNSWYNNESEAETLRKTEVGDTSLVSSAEALLDKLNSQIEVPRKIWQRSPAGSFASIPDVLAGLPTPMRRQAHTPDERAPITILVVTTSSAGIDAATLAKRGIVILALVIALSLTQNLLLTQMRTAQVMLKAQVFHWNMTRHERLLKGLELI